MTPTEQAHLTFHEMLVNGVKSIPAISVSFAHFLLGIPVERWVSIAVLIYTVLQIIVFVRDKFLRDAKPQVKKPRK